MENTINILLLSNGNHWSAFFAEQRFLERNKNQISVVRASLHPKQARREELDRLGMTEIEEIPTEKSLPELGGHGFGLIITFGEKAKKLVAGNPVQGTPVERPAVLFIGSPILLHWDLAPVSEVNGMDIETLHGHK